MLELLLLLAALALAILAYYDFNSSSNTDGENFLFFPPGLSPSDPKTGNLSDISASGSFHEFLVDLHKRFGVIASFWYRTQICVSIASVKMFKETQLLFDRPLLLYNLLRPLLGEKAIQFANGFEGRSRHRLYLEAFNRSTCEDLMPKLQRLCREFVKNEIASKSVIPLHESMKTLSVRLLTAAHFGVHEDHSDELGKSLSEVYEEVMDEMNAMTAGQFSEEEDPKRFKRFVEKVERFRGIIKGLLDRQREAKESGDYERAPFLDMLIDKVADEETAISDAITFALGGFDTTSNLLTWLFYFLAKNPDVQDRVFEEVTDALTRSLDGTLIDVKDNLVYTTQVMDETLRRSITAPMTARVDPERTVNLGRFQIPPGTPIINAIGVVFLDPDLYPSDPEIFDPDHFSPSQTRSNVSFSPFGMGQRKCPGYRFSIHQVFAAIATIVPQFKLSPASKADLDVRPKFGFVTRPQKEILIALEKRSGDHGISQLQF